MKVKAVLLDFDGTLVDSNDLINQSHLTVLEKIFPGEYTLDSVRQFNGPPLNEVYGTLVPEREEELVAEYREINAQLHDEMIHLFDGVKEECTHLKEQGIALAIVSTKREVMINRGLRILGMDDLFDVVIGAESYTHFKPHPEPIYRALAELNVDLNQTLMVGDNGHDIEAAKRAGIPAVWVEWSQKTKEEIASYEPDYIVSSMAELSALVLEQAVETAELEETRL